MRDDWIGRNGHDEAGFAILTTVVIAAVVIAIVAGTLYRAAVDNVTASGHNVDQEQALQAAQGGVDAAYQHIQSASRVTEAPCGTGAVTGTLGSAPGLSTYSVAATYYSTVTAATALTCTQLRTGSVPKAVELESLGTDGGQTQKMVSEADLAVTATGSVFGDALFVNSSTTFTGNDTFTTNNQTVYVNGSATCTASGKVTGTLVVADTLTLSGDCPIGGIARAGGRVIVPSGSPSVERTLISTTGTTPGITVQGNPTFHNMFAKTAIHYPSTWTGHGTIDQHDTSLSAPPPQTFPTVNWSAAKYQAAGYTVVTTSTCTAVYRAIFAIRTSAKPEAIDTTCKVTIPHSSSTSCPSWEDYYCTHVYLGKSLVIFSTAGFTLPTPATFTTSTSSGVDLALIVPTGTSCASSNGNITFSGKIKTHVDTLFFTPCTASLTGSAAVSEGEVYSGVLKAANGMKFGLPLTLPTTSGGSVNPAGPASVGIVYEREAST